MARRQGGTLGTFTPLSTPNAPTDLSVSTSIGSATVSFTAPTDTGDGAVTSYVVTAIDESTGASSGATGSASPITISPGGGTFKIRAQAVNGFGPGRLTEFSTGNSIFSGAELYAWGRNESGQLGDGTVVYRSSPVQVGGDADWAQASACNSFSLAVKTDGTLWAWGDNFDGQLGLNDQNIDRSSPIQVGALTNWSGVFARTTALKTDGTLWAWGANARGEVGDGTATARSSPVQVGALTDWAQTDGAYGTHNAAITTGNELYTWGYNSLGQLGHNDTISRSSPVQVGLLTNWAQVSTGENHTGAVKTDGTLWMWGFNYHGQVGEGAAGVSERRSSPIQVGALTNWSQLSLGNAHTGAVKTDGTLWMWGQGNNGRLGDGTTISRSSPVQIGALTTWAQVAAGNLNSFAVKTDGTLWAWGYGGSGNLGQNNTATTSSPVQIGSLLNWTQVSVKNNHAIATLGVV